jgi:DNA-binding response OmpR family regulator
MNVGAFENLPKALIVVKEPGGATALAQVLIASRFSVLVSSDPTEALERLYADPRGLVLVEDDLSVMSGVRFLMEVLKIDWKAFSILITDEDEESVHDKTEGLGILGSIRNMGDVEGLRNLVSKYLDIVRGK